MTSLPQDFPYLKIILQNIARLRINLEMRDNQTKQIKEVIMNLSPAYDKWLEKVSTQAATQADRPVYLSQGICFKGELKWLRLSNSLAYLLGRSPNSVKLAGGSIIDRIELQTIGQQIFWWHSIRQPDAIRRSIEQNPRLIHCRCVYLENRCLAPPTAHLADHL
jgi:hypothetical protein